LKHENTDRGEKETENETGGGAVRDITRITRRLP